jgi:hypothetical protein
MSSYEYALIMPTAKNSSQDFSFFFEFDHPKKLEQGCEYLNFLWIKKFFIHLFF